MMARIALIGLAALVTTFTTVASAQQSKSQSELQISPLGFVVLAEECANIAADRAECFQKLRTMQEKAMKVEEYESQITALHTVGAYPTAYALAGKAAQFQREYTVAVVNFIEKHTLAWDRAKKRMPGTVPQLPTAELPH